MIPRYPFGFDYGNAETCGYLIENNTKRARRMPSLTAFGSLSKLAETRSAIGDAYDRDVDALKAGECVIELQNSEYFVGQLAYQSKAADTGFGNANRYWSNAALAVLLTISGEMISAPEYELFLVTGLPIKTFTKENRARVRAALEGEHIFILNGRKRRAIIHVARVVMEGAGAMIAYGKDEEVLQGVIDIGGRTTDLYVAQGQKPYSDLCRGETIGVEDISTFVDRKFSATYGRELKAEEKAKLLWSLVNATSPFPVLQANGIQVGKTSIRPWLEIAQQRVGQRILDFVSTVWNTSERGAVGADIAPILLIGGGAHYFASTIQARIPHAIVPYKPEVANAEGYLSLARVLMELTSGNSASAIA